MKKMILAAASAAMFFAASWMVLPEAKADNSIFIGPVNTYPCLSGYRLTVLIRIYDYGVNWTFRQEYTKGFNSQAEMESYVMSYNTGNFVTQMTSTIVCETVVSPGPGPI